jgi:hypothetical protein
MTIAPQWLFLGGLAALGASAGVLHTRWKRKRRAAFAEYSMVRGFTFAPNRPDGERRLRDVFEPFNQGHSRKWGNTISGSRSGVTFTAFPKFALGPEGWFSRLGQMLGMQDLDFPESPEFSNAYRLRGPDESSIRQLFTPEIREFFAATPQQHVAGGGQSLPSVDQLDEWLERGDHVRRRFFKT